MIVYLVQRLAWKWDDEKFVLRDDAPIKAFESRDDAEAFRQEEERIARKGWGVGDDRERRPGVCLGETGRLDVPDRFFEVVALELGP